jgi:hypothetical protein
MARIGPIGWFFVVILVSSLIIWRAAVLEHESNAAHTEQAAKGAAAAAQIAAAASAAEAARLFQCANGFAGIAAKAAEEIKQGNAGAAVEALSRCQDAPGAMSVDRLLAGAKTELAKQEKQRLSAAEKEKERFLASERRQKKSEGVSLGMSRDDVMASSWGRPNEVHRTTTATGTHEQWVYGGGYLYFDNGVLTAVQN